MAEPKQNELMEKIVSLCKRRGFIYQSSEIYGGINGFWDYGPLGAELKRNVKELWWTTMTRLREDVVGLEATIIMAPQIWKASGHVDTFSDPMCDCLTTGRRYRADQVEPQSGTVYHYWGAFPVQLGAFRLPPTDADYFKQNVEPLKTKAELSGLVKKLQQSSEESERSLALCLSEFVEGREGSIEPFAVLLPDGKPRPSADKVAMEFYKRRGANFSWPLLQSTERVENSQRFNPENGSLLTEPRPFNLMFKTYVGPVADEENVAYLRPETAQAIFAQFKNVLETSRQKVPFGIAQVGKAFRNEVTPRNYTFRSREFEQMELEFFIKPDEAVEAMCGSVSTETSTGHPWGPQPNWGWQMWHAYWVEERMRFYEGIGLPRKTLVEYWQKPEELAHYARATVDILYKFPFSKRDEQGELMGEELEGIAARSDFDLSQHERFSGKPMGVFDEELRAAWGKLDDAKKKELSQRYYEARKNYLTKSGVPVQEAALAAQEDADGLAKGQYIPHVIEPSAGVDRLILALICNAYTEKTATDEKGKTTTEVVLRFHPRVAPIKVGVFPLLKNKPELVKKAREVFEALRGHMNVFYDEAGSIGRRYARQDEAGTPFCVTIDFDTLGEKPELLNTVTLRQRDDGSQERVLIADLLPRLLAAIR